MGIDVTECLSLNLSSDPMICAIPKQTALPAKDRADPAILVNAANPRIRILDLTDEICPPEHYVCLPLKDHTVIWQSEYLITATFARSLSPAFEAVLSAAGGREAR
jgi:hypothetical protein